MNILFLCNKNPYPERDGGCLGMNVMINEAVRCGHFVKVLAVNSSKNFVNPNELPEKYRNYTHYENVFMDLKVRPLSFLSTFFTKKSPHIIRFISKDFEEKLISILKQTDFDLVRVESVFMAPYVDTIRKYSNARIDMRAHNIEHLIWERLCAASKNPLKKMLLKHVCSTLKTYEQKAVNTMDVISAISLTEKEWFEKYVDIPVNYVPFGLDIHKVKYDDTLPSVANSIFYIGAMNWEPNVEGIDWFLDNVWPLVRMKRPDLKFYLAGRYMPQKYFDVEYENVLVLGEVPSVYDYMFAHEIMVVPLLSGGGVRVKIFEGMSMAKPIVTSSVGAEGIDLENGRDIMIADNAEDFADAIIKLADDRNLAKSIGENAREAVNKYDIRNIFNKWISYYH